VRKGKNLRITERKKWDRRAPEYFSGKIEAIKQMCKSPQGVGIKKILMYGKSSSLEVGCGSGINSLILSKLQNVECCLLDFSKEMIRISHRIFLTMRSEANFIIADMRHLPFRNKSFAFIHSDCSIEHVREYNEAVSEIAWVLKTNGHIVATVPNKLKIDGWDMYIKYYKTIEYTQLSFTPWHLKSLFMKRGFRNIKLFGYEPVGAVWYPLLFRFVRRFLNVGQRNTSTEVSMGVYKITHQRMIKKFERILAKLNYNMSWPTFITNEIGIVAQKMN